MPTVQMMDERAFSFLRLNERQQKPRSEGITEIRGPYYTPMGRYYHEDILETMSSYGDSLIFAGGSFTLMPRRALLEMDSEKKTWFLDRLLAKHGDPSWRFEPGYPLIGEIILYEQKIEILTGKHSSGLYH